MAVVVSSVVVVVVVAVVVEVVVDSFLCLPGRRSPLNDLSSVWL